MFVFFVLWVCVYCISSSQFVVFLPLHVTHPIQSGCTTRSISSARRRSGPAVSAGTSPPPATRSNWPGCWTGRKPRLTCTLSREDTTIVQTTGWATGSSAPRNKMCYPEIMVGLYTFDNIPFFVHLCLSVSSSILTILKIIWDCWSLDWNIGKNHWLKALVNQPEELRDVQQWEVTRLSSRVGFGGDWVKIPLTPLHVYLLLCFLVPNILMITN